MDELLSLLLVGLISLAFGCLVSLPALLKPAYRALTAGAPPLGLNLAWLAVWGLLACGLSFVAWTRLQAEAELVFATLGLPEDMVVPEREPVIQELWVQLLVPPPLRPPCYSRQAPVCRQAEAILGWQSERAYRDYGRNLGCGLLSALGSWAGIWLWHRLRRRK